MKRVLIIACSQRKRLDAGRLPAIDRYDGPTFRVLRKFIREHEEDAPEVYVLSAKYGLIASDRRIPDYDVRLSKESAKRLRTCVATKARERLAGERWESVGICAGKDYRSLLDAVIDQLDEDRIEFIKGGQGPRLAALKCWLLKKF